MKIALVLLPMWSIETMPLGMASIISVLRKEGHEVRPFDINLTLRKRLGPVPWELATARAWGNVEEFRAHLLPQVSGPLTELAKHLVSEGFTAVGLTVYESNVLTACWFSTLLKFLNPEIRIVAGGPEVVPHEFNRVLGYVKQGVFDAAVVGEGEGSGAALFRAWERGEPIAGISGVMSGQDGKIQFVGRPPALDVNSLLPPDFSDFKIGEYEMPVIPIQFSRGCVANCSFCNEKAFLWPTFQQKAAGSVVDHLEHLASKHRVRSFRAVDSLLNGNHAKLNELCDLLISQGSRFEWAGNMRIDKRLREPLNHKLRKAGCYHVTFGVESGSNTVLKAMRKGITRDDTIAVVGWMRDAGIKVNANMIVGYPGETERDFDDTLDLIEKIGKHVAAYSTTIYTIDPLTEVGKNLKKFGIRVDEAGLPVRDENTTYLGNSWVSESGELTPEIRFDRLARLRQLIAAKTPQAVLAECAQG